MPTRPLGRAPRTHDPAIPHLSALLAGRNLPPPPVSQDWTRGMPTALGMMLNDTLDCCSCAAFYHAMQVWSFNVTGTMDTEPDSNVEALYCAVSFYQPSAAPPGPMCNEQQVLTHILKAGAPTGADGKGVNKLAAFVEVDPRMIDDIKRTIVECGIAYVGIKIPKYLDVDPWPSVWDVQTENDQPIGAHAVILAGYDEEGAKVISFGQVYTMTWAFFSQYADEAYALADPDWIAAKGTTPGGLDLKALEKQMQAIKAEPQAS
jgi:hypothetical protein